MTAVRPTTPSVAPEVPSTAAGQAGGTVQRLDRRIVLSGLWVAMLFVFAYVDIFAFWREDVIRGALAGTVPGVGFTVDQRFLALTTLYVLVPALMVVGSLVLPWRVNRTANVAVPLVYAVTVVLSMVGETWLYYLLGSVVEVVLLLCIARTAHRWR